MGIRGRYALMPETGLVRLAFVLEADAKRVAKKLLATCTEYENGMEGQWVGALTRDLVKKVETMFPAPIKRARTLKPETKRKRRRLPV